MQQARKSRCRYLLSCKQEFEEEDVSNMATLFWAEGVWVERWKRVLQKAWRKHIFEMQMWRQVRGLAGAVMCETRDLGIMWPRWHPLMLEGQVAVDMRVVCPHDVKKVLLKQARMVYWMKWAATHECEELKERVWLEPIQATLRRKTNEEWTDKHLNAMRKLVVEGGCVQKRLHDVWLVRRKEVSRL